MLEIILCEDVIFDLPPPTLFFRANNEGFKQLKDLIEKMILNKIEICLNEFDFVKVSDTTKRIIFKPFSKKILLRVAEREIITDLSPKDWKSILDKISSLLESDSSLTYFIEFENYFEEGNIVLES